MNKIRMKMAPSFKLGAICFVLFITYLLLLFWRILPEINTYKILDIEPSNYLRGKWVSTISIALIPAIGWLFAAYISTRNLMRQHSMSVLLQTRTSSEYMAHAKVAHKYLLDTSLDITRDSNKSDRDDILYILNFFEFVSIGIIHKELDEKIFEKAWKNTFKSTADTHKKFIEQHQKNRATIWEHFIWLNDHWQKQKFYQTKFFINIKIIFLIILGTILFCIISTLSLSLLTKITM